VSGDEQSNLPSSHRSFLELPITHFATEWNGEWSRQVEREGTVRDLLSTWDIDDPDERSEIAQVLRHLRDAKAIVAAEITSLRAELAAAQKQRDEARRECCYLESTTRWQYAIEPSNQHSIATERGWDCFKEGGGA
jgi:hypothetical protein